MISQSGKKVLVIAKGFPPEIGGVETYSEKIARGYVAQGCDVTVLTRFPEDKAGNGAPDSLSIVNVGSSSNQPLVLARFILALLRFFFTGKRFAVVHATTWRAFLPMLILKFLGLKLSDATVVTVHGREILQTRGKLYKLMTLCFRHVDKVVYISDFSRNSCEAYCPALKGKAVVAWNGISWPSEPSKSDYEIDPRHIKILAVSQLTKRKNVAALINVVKRINDGGELSVKLKVAGTGNQRSALDEQIRSLGLEDAVTMLGMVPRNNLPDLYREADIFVHPHSHSHDKTDVETFCLVVADGMALGVPTVSGRDGAPSEYLVHRENGMVVDGSNESELYDIILELVAAGAGKRRELGQRAHEFAVGNFNWTLHVGKVLDALRSPNTAVRT